MKRTIKQRALQSFLLSTFLLSANIYAAGAVNGAKITKMYCGYYSGANMCSIYFDKAITNPPSCHGASQRMQIKTDNDTGKAILSLALTAFSTQKTVDIGGKGTCDIWSETEDMNVIIISN